MSPFPHLVIRASAGTGKTFQLSNRYLGLAAAGESPEQILSATFARKAAGEILDRVLVRLADSITNPESLWQLARQLERPNLDQSQCGELLQSLIQRLHRLRVGTLDSFFVQFAGSYGLELGLPPGWRICDEIFDASLRADAVQEILQSEETHSVIELMHLLNKGDLRRSITDQIFDVVQKLHGLFLETDRASWHSLPHRRPLHEDELIRAVDNLASFEPLPADQRFKKAFDKDLENAQAEDWAAFLKSGLAKASTSDSPAYYKKPLPATLLEAYRPLIDHARSVLVNRVAHQTEASYSLLARFNAAYQALKRSRRALRFEDVTRSLCNRLADLGVQDVSYRLDAQIAHLLLDEFQDTSLAQWSVLHPIAEQVTESASGRSFFCVGDVKQAIYGWRGGVAAVFEAVTNSLSGLAQQPLNQSFRSSPPVIETVNRVFLNLQKADFIADQPELADSWRTRYAEHSTARTSYGGFCRLLTAPRAAEGTPQIQATIRHAAAIVAEIVRTSPGRTVGVLVRRNEVLARLSFELREIHQIAASEEGGNPLTDSSGVQLILSLLMAADHPGNTAARYHIANSPLGEFTGLTEWRNDRKAGEWSRRTRLALLESGYGATIYDWVSRLASHSDSRELKRLLQLVELAYRFERQATLRPDDFVRFVTKSKVEDPTAANVRIMTIHQSKGLQFDHVVLPELDGKFTGLTPMLVSGRDEPTGPIRRVCRFTSGEIRQLLPSEFQRMFTTAANERWNEALCVLYVALTRAIHGLHLVVAPSKENEKKIPSTPAGLLRATLTEGAPTLPLTTLFETGDPDWDLSHGEDATEEYKPDLLGEPSPVRLAPNPATRIRGLLRQSPSGREGGGYVGLGRVLSEESNAAMARGTIFHKWFEQIEWLDNAVPQPAALRDSIVGLPVESFSVSVELDRFFRLLEAPRLKPLLTRQSYSVPATSPWAATIAKKLQTGAATLEVQNERTFALRDEAVLLQGSLDRVVWCREGTKILAADIIDYKTDSLDAGDDKTLQELVELYRPQLDAYRQAIARMSGLKPKAITARLVFVSAGIVAPV